MDELLREFLTETNESIDVIDMELVRFEQDPNNADILGNVFRLVHTIKGTCGFLELPRLEALTHAAEALIGRFRNGLPVTREAVTLVLATIDRIKALLDAIEHNHAEAAGDDQDLIGELNRMATRGGAGSAAAAARAARADDDGVGRAAVRGEDRIAQQSIRVHLGTLENLMTMVSELVLTRNQLLEIVRRHDDSDFKVPLQRLSIVTAELQDGVMKTRMQPIGKAWQKLPRVVRDLAADLGKDIELEMHGAETELDRQVLDLIKDPLIHMVRNAADHGLETPSERWAMGKPARGSLRLAARHEGGHILVELADDGRGLDTARIKAKAGALGLVPADEIERMPEAAIHQLIFTPGFSTAEKVTSVSGRGVGLDVVRANIDQIGGTIEVKSVHGRGTAFHIKIPLTLAIVAALIVEVAGERYAIPQLSVLELVRVGDATERRIERIQDAAVLRLRDRLLPVVSLRKVLRRDAAATATHPDDGFVIVIDVAGQLFGVMVDAIHQAEEIVVKPLARKIRHISLFCGNTILGDGAVVMIVDPKGISDAVGGIATPRLAEEDGRARAKAAEEAATESLLLFRAGSPHLKAIPLSLVTRLEEIDARTIEYTGGRAVVQYRDGLMPLVPADDAVRIRSEGAQPLLVFGEGGRSMALVVDEIVDIVQDRIAFELVSERPGVLGSAIINGQATEVVDIAHFLPLGFEGGSLRAGAGVSAPRHVLLVDDTPFFRNMLVPLLKAAGMTVTAVGSGAEALALAGEGRHFDVIITDIDMPGMSGFELAGALRADARTAELPVIGLSTHLSAEEIERSRSAGLHGFVAKFDRYGLIAALKQRPSGIGRAA